MDAYLTTGYYTTIYQFLIRFLAIVKASYSPETTYSPGDQVILHQPGKPGSDPLQTYLQNFKDIFR